MWNLDDESLYFRLAKVTISRAFTWGDRDRDKREVVREAALQVFPATIPSAQSWAFRIFVSRPDDFDVDNVPKIIMDAFCAERIRIDGSHHISISLYEDDSVRSVDMVQVAGRAIDGEKMTTIEVFGRRTVAPSDVL